MFFVYILQSLKDKRTYVGQTTDIKQRFFEHNSGRVLATKNRRPLAIIKTEIYPTLKEARIREKYWKSSAGRKKMKKEFFTI